ncbi:Met-10+ like-protein-domain-containing protein [Jackrogersella minutella]|nr:Met-10+ like-protein-domain-containing protein [Jackrogersella minutella]
MSAPSVFRPPIIRSAFGVLDRSLFSKTVNIAAAAVADKRNIAAWRTKLLKEETLLFGKIPSVALHPDRNLGSKGLKCLLLHPKIDPREPETWTPTLQIGVSSREIGIIPYRLELNYDNFSYEDVMKALLPIGLRDEHDGIPGGFNQAGHVAHMNLKEMFLPYKNLIAEVLLDKNPAIKTVINKIDKVGTESEFRTFAYEILGGTDDLYVETRENECSFHFDYSEVYWNSKLEAEHGRLVKLFQPGEAVCDVMAGVGPFAVPAGKKGVFVFANDYNPKSFLYLGENIKRNKVEHYVRPFNQDGRIFIKKAVDLVYNAYKNGEHAVTPPSRKEVRQSHPNMKKPDRAWLIRSPKRVRFPPTINHFVMNLPASAITFLPRFRGLYAEREPLFAPHTDTKLPLVHVYCFGPKADDDIAFKDICERISAELGVEMKPGDAKNANEVSIMEIRNVAPNKNMFCASFRVPPEVAFAPRTNTRRRLSV